MGFPRGGALVVLPAGVVVLARSPLVAGTHEAGDLDEMLGRARRRAHATIGVVDAPVEVATP